MRQIIGEVLQWAQSGGVGAVATVTATWHSAPQPVGTSMAVTPTGEAIGSVSGGCVEGAVYEVCQEVIETRQPQVVRYGVADSDAFAVGLTCGGTIELLVVPVSLDLFPELPEVAQAITNQAPVAIATVCEATDDRIGQHMIIWPDHSTGTFGRGERMDRHVVADVQGLLDVGEAGQLRYGSDGERLGTDVAVFVQAFAPPPQMFVFGAIDFARSVVQVGKLLGYHVTVCDARPIFATKRRFPEADELVVKWPHKFLAEQEIKQSTVICCLTHDHKFDIPLLRDALRSKAGYIGAMGSRRTHDQRLELLREAGVTEAELARLHSPIGLDLGGRTPAETAIAVGAEIVQVKRGGLGDSLKFGKGPIHRPEDPTTLAADAPAQPATVSS